MNIQVSRKWRTHYVLPYRGCLNVHEKNMKNIFQTKKSIIAKILLCDNIHMYTIRGSFHDNLIHLFRNN
jgi:hypothetical protein